MATKKELQAADPKTSTALATTDVSMFAADAGAGMEGADRDSFAIPFLSVLQKGSPTVDEALPTYNPAHKAGMFFENVGGTTYEGKAGVEIVPCAFRRVFIRWAQKGFAGEFTPEDVAAMRERKEIVELDGRLYAPEKDGSVNVKTCDTFKDTRNHYVLLLDGTGGWREALLSLSSTQIKKSKMLMSALAAVKIQGPAGMFTPPPSPTVCASRPWARATTRARGSGCARKWRAASPRQTSTPPRALSTRKW